MRRVLAKANSGATYNDTNMASKGIELGVGQLTCACNQTKFQALDGRLCAEALRRVELPIICEVMI